MLNEKYSTKQVESLREQAETSKDPYIRRYARCLLRLADGFTRDYVRKEERIDVRTLASLEESFFTNGIDALYARKPRRKSPPGREKPLIKLTAKQREALKDHDDLDIRRKRIILEAEKATTFRQVAKKVRIDHKVVANWIKRFRENGGDIDSLRSKRTGPKPRKAYTQLESLLRLLDQKPEKGRKYHTNASLAAKTGLSEPYVEQLLHGIPHPHRRPEKKTIDDIRRIALKLEREVIKVSEGGPPDGCKARILVKCLKCGDEKLLSAHTIIYDRSRCSKCWRIKPERLSTEERVIDEIEKMIGIKFERRRLPNFFRKYCGKSLQLDGWHKERKIGIEYQGSHHYRPTSYGGGSIKSKSVIEHHERTVVHDKLKRKVCKELGYRLIIVHEIRGEVTEKKIKSACLKALKAADIKPESS